MNPRSIAIVGVSERADAAGSRIWANLRRLGFPGPIYLVNPRYAAIDGTPCYPTLSALPETVDAAFLAVPAAAGPDLAEEAGRRGIGALFINANGYADGDAQGLALQRRVEDSAARYGMALCGPNNLGLVNVHAKKAMWTPLHMKQIRPGPIGVISQSGSVAMILSEDERDLGFAYLVTTGNEAGATVADYLSVMVRDDRVGVVLLFLETIRDPALLAEAALEAARRGKRIIALKLGTSEAGCTLVQAHTGSLAGEDRLYDAFFKALGIVRVRELDEMLETAVLFAASGAAPPAPQTVIVTLSGGEAALLADLGSALGVAFAPLAPATLARLRPAFPPHSTIANPIDAWGLGFSEERFQLILEALLDDPGIGTIGFAVDAPGRGGCDVHIACIMARVCARFQTDKRLVFINNTSGSGVNADVRGILDAASAPTSAFIPYLSGMRTALCALRNLHEIPALAATPLPGTGPSAGVPTQAATLPVDEPGRFQALTQAGIPMVATERVASAAAAVAAAARFGYPVVLKGVASHLPHKSDLGLVRLGLQCAADVSTAFAALEAILARHAQAGSAAQIVIQKMAGEGIELIFGIRNDKQFGSFVIAGPGGVLVEISQEASVCLGPVDTARARAMLEQTAAARLLRGVRGKGPWDIEAAIAALVAFSRFGAAHRATLAALEINPLIVGTQGVLGVDVLLEPHTATEENGA